MRCDYMKPDAILSRQSSLCKLQAYCKVAGFVLMGMGDLPWSINNVLMGLSSRFIAAASRCQQCWNEVVRDFSCSVDIWWRCNPIHCQGGGHIARPDDRYLASQYCEWIHSWEAAPANAPSFDWTSRANHCHHWLLFWIKQSFCFSSWIHWGNQVSKEMGYWLDWLCPGSLDWITVLIEDLARHNEHSCCLCMQIWCLVLMRDWYCLIALLDFPKSSSLLDKHSIVVIDCSTIVPDNYIEMTLGQQSFAWQGQMEANAGLWCRATRFQRWFRCIG